MCEPLDPMDPPAQLLVLDGDAKIVVDLRGVTAVTDAENGRTLSPQKFFIMLSRNAVST